MILHSTNGYAVLWGVWRLYTLTQRLSDMVFRRRGGARSNERKPRAPLRGRWRLVAQRR